MSPAERPARPAAGRRASVYAAPATSVRDLPDHALLLQGGDPPEDLRLGEAERVAQDLEGPPGQRKVGLDGVQQALVPIIHALPPEARCRG